MLEKLELLEMLLRGKHLPGRHDQQRHAPKHSMFPNSDKVLFNTPGAEQRVREVLGKLPDKARKLITQTSSDISFWTKPGQSGGYLYSGGQHRVVFSDDASAFEEFGHMVDKELGLLRGRASEYSRSKVYRNLMQQEPGIGTNPVKARVMGYTAGLATEDFAKAFADYVDRPDWLYKNRPMRYAHMQELFGDES